MIAYSLRTNQFYDELDQVVLKYVTDKDSLPIENKSDSKSYRALYNQDYDLDEMEKKKVKRNTEKFEIIILKYYFNKMSQMYDSVETNMKIMSGMPIIKGTRIPITTILQYFKEEELYDSLQEDFGLDRSAVEESMDYVIDIMRRPYYEG